MSNVTAARELLSLVRKIQQEGDELVTAAAWLAFNKMALQSETLIDILHEYVEFTETHPFVLGQEVLCPDGLGRISEIFGRPQERLRIETYFNNRSCVWDVSNIKRWPK